MFVRFSGGVVGRLATREPYQKTRLFQLQTNFTSSALVRLLAERAGVQGPVSGGAERDFAERLSQWLSAFDAITLRGVQQQLQALADGAAPASPPTEAQLAALKKLLERVRGSLLRGLADVNAAAVASAAAGQGPASLPGMRLPAGMSKYVDQTELPGGEGTYAAFQQRYLDQQRQMETKIASLRAHVRQVLSASTPRLQQLAALDAAMDKMIDARRQQLLGRVSPLLERRFEQLRQAHEAARAAQAPEAAAAPGADWRPGGWLHGFSREWQEALVAELEVRLQPVVGLMEAFGNEIEKRIQ